MPDLPTELLNCLAPAKLNLFLHITGRRPDGYHLLQSVFTLIDRADSLDFRLRQDQQIRHLQPIPGVNPENDLVIRAARLLQDSLPAAQAARLPGVDILLRKQLPMGGGLGGGSSDAATTLWALNTLWQTGLSRNELMHLGSKLGADVPFFLFGQSAFAEGIGELLQPVEIAAATYLVIEPGVAAPTPQIFSSPELTRDSKPVKIADFSETTKNGKQFGRNDLEKVATALYPDIQDALDWLNQFGNARMSGSGACVFCRFDQRSAAESGLQQTAAHCSLKDRNWRYWIADGLIQHPMQNRMPLM